MENPADRRGKTAPRRGDAVRDALVQAAAEAVWLDGYAASSLARIAKRANVPVGNVYYYYKTKAEIAAAVAGYFVAQTRDLVSAIEGACSEPRDRLQLLVARLKATQAERVRHGCPIYAAVRGFRQTAPEASVLAAQSFEVLITFISAEFRRTGVRPSLANAQARAVVAVWQGGMATSHALGEPLILTEAYSRMEQMMGLRTERD